MAVPLLAVLGMGMGGFGLLQSIPAISNKIRYFTNSKWANTIPDASTLILLRWRGYLSPSQYAELMRKIGFSETYSENMYKISENKMNLAEIIRYKWRYGMSDADYKKRVENIGYTVEEATEIEKVMKYFPSAPDLIRFAVREVYSPKIRSDYGLDEDFPPEFAEEAKKVGMDKEQAKNYWASHWILPSVEQGYEMLHRGEITEAELNTLMRTQDIMPFWREKLMKISYRPYTRVDVRRMHKIGVLSDEDVKEAYKWIGFDDERAEKMKEFTIRYNRETEKTLSESKIRKAYLSDLISVSQAEEYLSLLDFTDDDIAFILSLWDLDKMEKTADETDTSITEEKKKERDLSITMIRNSFYDDFIDSEKCKTMIKALGYDDEETDLIFSIWEAYKEELLVKNEIDALIDRYAIGELSDIELSNELDKLALPSQSREKFLRYAQTQRKRAVKLPTKTDLMRWYKKEYITEEELFNRLHRYGYRKKDIELYIRELKEA